MICHVKISFQSSTISAEWKHVQRSTGISTMCRCSGAMQGNGCSGCHGAPHSWQPLLQSFWLPLRPWAEKSTNLLCHGPRVPNGRQSCNAMKRCKLQGMGSTVDIRCVNRSENQEVKTLLELMAIRYVWEAMLQLWCHHCHVAIKI